MHKERLENTRDYFDNITKVAYQQFMNGEVSFLVVYSLAAGLFHIAEWMCLHDLGKVHAKFGIRIADSGDLWHQVVAQQVPDAGFIRDLNNAAKHAILRFRPSTAMHHSANTFIHTAGYGEGGYGAGPFGSKPEVKMDEAGREVLLEPIATSLFQFWEVLVDEFYPPPPSVLTVTAGPPAANS